MSLQDEPLELNAVKAENEALRALLADYAQLLTEVSARLLAYDAMRWNIRHVELKGRYDALLQGGQL